MVGVIKSGFVAGIPTDLVSKVAPAIEAHYDTVSKHQKVGSGFYTGVPSRYAGPVRH